MLEVPVIQRLQAQELKQPIALRLQRRRQLAQVEVRQLPVQQLKLNTHPHKRRKVLAIVHDPRPLRTALRLMGTTRQHQSQGLDLECLQQQPRTHVRVVRLDLDQRPGRHHLRQADLLQQDAVI